MSDQAQEVTAILAQGMGGDDEQSNGGEAGDTRSDGPETVQDLLGIDTGDSGESETPDGEPVEGLAEGTEGADPEGDASQDSEQDDSPLTVAELAEQMGVDAKAIYDELHVPLGDGETVTLGEFKDRVKDLRELDTLRMDFDDRQSKAEREQLSVRAEMNHLLSMLPPQMRDAMVREAGGRHRAYVDQQEKQVLEAIPEWKDADKRSSDRDAIIKLGNEYGFSEAEMSVTHDARTLKMVHDHVKLLARLQSVDLKGKRKEKKRPGAPGNKGRRNSGTLRNAINRAKQSGDIRDQTAAVSQLLRGQ